MSSKATNIDVASVSHKSRLLLGCKNNEVLLFDRWGCPIGSILFIGTIASFDFRAATWIWFSKLAT